MAGIQLTDAGGLPLPVSLEAYEVSENDQGSKVHLSKMERAVLEHIREQGKDGPKEIAAALGFKPASVRRTVQQLRDKDLITKNDGRTYRLLNGPETNPNSKVDNDLTKANLNTPAHQQTPIDRSSEDLRPHPATSEVVKDDTKATTLPTADCISTQHDIGNIEPPCLLPHPPLVAEGNRPSLKETRGKARADNDPSRSSASSTENRIASSPREGKVDVDKNGRYGTFGKDDTRTTGTNPCVAGQGDQPSQDADAGIPLKHARDRRSKRRRKQTKKKMCAACAGTKVQENVVQGSRYLCQDCGLRFDKSLVPPPCPRCGLNDMVRRKTWKVKPGGGIAATLRCLREGCKGVSFPLNPAMRHKHFALEVYAYALYHLLMGSRAQVVSRGVRKFFKIVNEICPATLHNWVHEYVDAIVPYLLSLKIDTSGTIQLDEVYDKRTFTAPDEREYSVEFYLFTSYDKGMKTRPAALLARSKDKTVAAQVILRIVARLRMPKDGITFWCDANSAYAAAYQDLVQQWKTHPGQGIDPEKVKMISVPKESDYSVINALEGVNRKWRTFLRKLKIDESLDFDKCNIDVQREIVIEDFFTPRDEFGRKSAGQNAHAEIDFGPDDTESIMRLQRILKEEQFKKYIVPSVRPPSAPRKVTNPGFACVKFFL